MSCFGGREPRLFLVDVTVMRLELVPARAEHLVGHVPEVKVKFVDLPPFVITRRSLGGHRDDAISVVYDPSSGGDYLFATGKSCLFVRKPRDLVEAIKATPELLRVGVFREGETYPLGETSVPGAGCFCDQVAMAGNDAEHMPNPYEAKGTYNLADPGRNHAGTIEIHFRLSYCGQHVVTDYQLQPNSFVFRNNFDDGEFRVKRADEMEMDESGDGLAIAGTGALVGVRSKF